MKNEKLRIGIYGASGRLGKAIAAFALQDPRFSLEAALTHSKSPHLGKDLSSLLDQKTTGLRLSSSLETKIDLLFDASLCEGFSLRCNLAQDLKLPFVVGTTNLSESDFKHLKNAALHIPVFYASNFSIGMTLMQKLASEMSRYFPSASIDLIETHHQQKKDVPSGSALNLAKIVETNRPGRPPIAIHSLRSGKIIGEHVLLFNTDEERITLSHEVHSRQAFAQGALQAALFLMNQKTGFYGMQDLLEKCTYPNWRLK